MNNTIEYWLCDSGCYCLLNDDGDSNCSRSTYHIGFPHMYYDGKKKSESRQGGSVLIIVLWILMIISFLAGQYLVHNRNKAEIALNAVEKLNRTAVTDSFFQLYRSSGWSLVKSSCQSREWIGLNLDALKFFVKISSESTRININTAQDSAIRDEIGKICSGGSVLNRYEKKADQLTDAILDWRDVDDLVRLNGAEKNYYIDLKKPYIPANGRFKKMTELLMVKGVTRALFSGKLSKDWQKSDFLNNRDYQDQAFVNKVSGSKLSVKRNAEVSENGKSRHRMLSLLEDFTVYPKSAKRISIRIISGNHHVYSEVFIFDKNMKQLEHLYNFYWN